MRVLCIKWKHRLRRRSAWMLSVLGARYTNGLAEVHICELGILGIYCLFVWVLTIRLSDCMCKRMWKIVVYKAIYWYLEKRFNINGVRRFTQDSHSEYVHTGNWNVKFHVCGVNRATYAMQCIWSAQCERCLTYIIMVGWDWAVQCATRFRKSHYCIFWPAFWSDVWKVEVTFGMSLPLASCMWRGLLHASQPIWLHIDLVHFDLVFWNGKINSEKSVLLFAIKRLPFE